MLSAGAGGSDEVLLSMRRAPISTIAGGGGELCFIVFHDM